MAAGEPNANLGENFKPTCLLECKGEVLLERFVRLLRKHGVQDIMVVVGYKAYLVKQFAEKKKLNVKFISSSYYSSSSAINSFILAIKHFAPDDSIVLCMGDVFLEEQALKALLNEEIAVCIHKKCNRELILAKFSVKDLGNLEDMRRWCVSFKYRKKTRPPLQVGFHFFLREHGAKCVDRSMMDFDVKRDLKKFRCH